MDVSFARKISLRPIIDPICFPVVPVTFVLPLPYGALVDTQKLRVVDEAGTAVPSQFEVMNKYWASTPQYLRHVMVHFQPSVSAWAG
jgi:hypothetical protein